MRQLAFVNATARRAGRGRARSGRAGSWRGAGADPSRARAVSSASASDSISRRIIICAAIRCAPAESGATPNVRANDGARRIGLPRLDVGLAERHTPARCCPAPTRASPRAAASPRRTPDDEGESPGPAPLPDARSNPPAGGRRSVSSGSTACAVIVGVIVGDAEQLGDSALRAVERRELLDRRSRLALSMACARRPGIDRRRRLRRRVAAVWRDRASPRRTREHESSRCPASPSPAAPCPR